MNVGSKKRIVHIVEDLKIGGLERVLASIVTSLDRNKYDVQVWCLASGGRIAEELQEKGVDVRILGLTSYYNPLNVWTLARLLRRERIDLVHTHGYFASTFARIAARMAGVPAVIAHVHSAYTDYSVRNMLIERFLSYFTDRIVCVSSAVEAFVTKTEGIAKKKTSVIYNGISAPDSPLSLEERNKLRLSLGLTPRDIIIAVVASLTRNKGHKILLEGFKEIWPKNPLPRLLIIGDGPERESLEAAAARLGIDQAVFFAGNRGDVRKLLQVCDILVLPSLHREGLGVAIIEAMAAGIPVIGSNLGGIPEAIRDGENGLLTAPGDVFGLANAMKKLIEDRELRVSMGSSGLQFYRGKFTLERMMRQIEGLYDELLVGRGR